MIVISTLCSHLLDGLPAEQIPRQEGVEGRGAPDDSAIVGAGGSPKAAGVLGHPSPEQVAAALAPQARGVPVAGVGAHQPVGAARGAQAARGGSSVGLPAGGGRQRLPLRQESIHFFLTSKLRQDRGVAQDTPEGVKQRVRCGVPSCWITENFLCCLVLTLRTLLWT